MTVLEFNRVRVFGYTIISNMTVVPGKAKSMSVYSSDSSTNPIFQANLKPGARYSKTAFRITSDKPVFKFYENGSGGSDEEASARIKVQFTSTGALQIGRKIGDVAVR